MRLPLPDDMTRCHGLQCDKWRTCARNQTLLVDTPSRDRSYASELCLPVDGDKLDFYIEVTR